MKPRTGAVSADERPQRGRTVRRRLVSRAAVRSPRKALIKRLDDLAKRACMARAGAALFTDEGRNQWWGRCLRCGKITWLSWCHGITRASHSVRWNEDNSWAWCRGCHRYLDQHWEEKREWIITMIGQKRFSRVLLRSRARNRPDLAVIEVYLRAALEER